MTDRGGRFYLHDYADKDGPRELRQATLVGVELDDGSTVELGLRHGRVDLCSDRPMSLHPRATNLVEVRPEYGYSHPSRLTETQDDEADRVDAQHAFHCLYGLVSRITHPKTTKRAADRESVADELRAHLNAIRRVL